MDSGNRAEPLAVKRVDLPALFDDFVEIVEDMDAHQGLHFVHLGISSGHHDFDFAIEAEILQIVESFFEARILKGQHAAFKRMVEFGGMETEHAHVAKMRDGLAANLHAEGVGRVVDQFEVVTTSDVGQGIDFAGVTKDVHGQDSRSPGRNGGLDLLGVQCVVVRLDVDEDGSDLVPKQSVGGRDESERGRDDLAGNPHSLQPDLQRQCTIVEEAHVVHLEIVRQLTGKALKNRAVVRQPLAVPYFLKPVGELFNWREEGTGDVDRLLEWLRDWGRLLVASARGHCFGCVAHCASSLR